MTGNNTIQVAEPKDSDAGNYTCYYRDISAIITVRSKLSLFILCDVVKASQNSNLYLQVVRKITKINLDVMQIINLAFVSFTVFLF